MRVLILYYQQYENGIRNTVKEHLYSFRRYSEEQYYYLNIAGGIPSYLGKIRFDLVIYHYTLCACRFQPGFFDTIESRWQRLKSLSGYKAAMPQDEYVNSESLCRLFKNFGIQTVFTCLPESEWSKVYPLDKSGVHDFVTVLTGYVDENVISTLAAYNTDVRSIDVGYRARKNPYSLGRHATIKWRVAEVFRARQPQSSLHLDISTDPADVFFGEDWYRFLCQCRTILGCEGGASLHDPDGSIERAVAAFLKQHPDATFEETEQACFPGKDGNLVLFALSPRHFEACITRTCQVLVEGEYGGIFKPGIHYIELKKDWSNLNEVLGKIADHGYCRSIAENAYRDIVASGRYTYGRFVKTVIKHLRQRAVTATAPAGSDVMFRKRLLLRERYGFLFLIPSFVVAMVRGPLRKLFYAIGCPDGYERLKKLVLR